MSSIMKTITFASNSDYKNSSHLHGISHWQSTVTFVNSFWYSQWPPDVGGLLIIQRRNWRNVKSFVQCHTTNEWRGDLRSELGPREDATKGLKEWAWEPERTICEFCLFCILIVWHCTSYLTSLFQLPHLNTGNAYLRAC